MILGNDNKDQQSYEKQLEEAGQTAKHDLKNHENELGYNKVRSLLVFLDGSNWR